MWPCSVVLGKVCVDKGHQRGSARKGGLVLRLCCVPDQMLAAYLRIRNILPRMPRSVWDCESDCLIVSLVWCIRQGALSRFIKRDGHGASSVQGKHLVFEKRAVCSFRIEMQVPKGSLYWRHIAPSQRPVSELRPDVSRPGARQGWVAG